MLSVLIVEDHEMMLDVLVRLVQTKTDMDVVAVARSAEEGLQLLKKTKVDLVLVDISLPKITGIDLVAQLQQEQPELPCIMLSGHIAIHYVRLSLKAGARGYLLKDNPEEILDGMKAVLNGDIYISKQFDNI